MQKNIISVLALGAALWASAQDIYTPPVTLTIDSQEALDLWTQEKTNASDTRTFAYSSDDGGAVIKEERYTDIDHWLISPPVELVAGTEYKIIVTCKKGSSISSDFAKFSINVGSEATAESLATILYKNENYTEKNFTDVTAVYTPEQSGSAYFGIHCYNTAFKGGFVVKALAVDKVVPRPGAVTGFAIAAAPEGALQAVLTWTWPDKSDLGGVLEQISGAYVYRGTSSYFTANDESLVGTYTVDAVPGTEATWTDTTVPSPGKYYYKVVPFNENGASPTSPTAVQSPWVGKDTGISAVSDVVAAASPESETTVLLSFTLPTGTNGGYVDTSDIAYKITRKAGSGTTVTLEDAYSGELPYVDSTIPGLDSYTYTVYTVYNGSTSWSGKESNAIVTGGTAAIPYSQDFSATNSTALFTFFHGPDASRDWSRSSSALQYWGSPADAWAVLPKFRLEADKAYKFSFTTKVSRASSPKHLYVYVGTEPTAEALTEQVFYEVVESQYYGQRTVTVSVPATGDYCIAFRCYGPSDSNDLYVDDITLEETVVTPLPVTEAKAEAAPQGELKAVLSWANPSRTNAGGEITVLEKVEVLNGTDVVATVDAPVAGSESSASVTVDAPGVYTYSVVPYLNGLAGEAVEVTTPWLGHDTPVAPQNVAVEDTEAGRIVTFDAVTDGVNGGYVDGSALRYTITRNGEVLTDDLDAPTFTDTEADLPLAVYTYAVSAHCNGLEGEAVSAAPMQLGAALNLPYTPDFSDKATFDLWTFSKNSSGNPAWTYDSSNGRISAMSSAWAYTPPFMADQGTAKVSFKATKCFNFDTSKIMVYLCTENNADAKAAPTLIAEFEPKGISWPDVQEHTFDIPESGKYYIGYNTATSDGGRIWQSDIEQLTTTGIDAMGAPDGVIVNPDGSLSFACDGTLTLYSLSGAAVWSEATQGGVVRPAVQKGIYVAAWQSGDGSTLKFKYIAK